VLRHRQDAEDVAQEAFTKAYRSFWQLRDRTRFRAWLVRTTWRTALDRQKANRRLSSREIGKDPIHLTATSDALAGQRAISERPTTLAAAIDALPEKLRIVIVLATIEGHDVQAVAALLRIPEGTVKSRLFLARQKLRESLT
jgi:RNA polymerase sigma-70 factor (ECF subfamily)